MSSVLVFGDSVDRAAMLAHDLAQAGMAVLHQTSSLAALAGDAQQYKPDVLACHVAHADATFFEVIQTVAIATPCAVLVFSNSLDEGSAIASVIAGVHAYVADGYAAHRLSALVQLAQARFQHKAALTQALQDAQTQLQERKVVDHAKTILMRARQLTDDDAFRLMRTASMHSNQRLSAVSEHIIHAARFADGVNRAGQLRMLSQRLVKLYAMQLLRPSDGPQPALKEAVKRIDDNLKLLMQNFAQPELAELVKQAALTWQRLKKRLKERPPAHEMGVVDSLAEALLVHAEQLTGQLGLTGSAPPLQVLNLAGRQRMLSQRFAKFALLQALGKTGDTQAMLAARSSFEAAQHYLNNIPLSTPEIGQLLATAKLDWKRLLSGAEQASHASGQAEIESASEALLSVFEQLSATYESSMQMLMG